MYQITDKVFQGGNKPESMPVGINALICLQYWGEEKGDKITGDEVDSYIWLPIPDADFPGIKWLEMAVGIIESLEKADKKIYIYCREGISRSVMLTAGYLIKTKAMTVDQALEHISQTNRRLGPNSRFILGLKDYYNHLYRRD